MSPYDPTTWGLVTWGLMAWAAYYTTNFFVHYFRFRRLEREAMAGSAEAIEAYNAALGGFPASGYAKMLGKRRIRPSRGTEEDGLRFP